MPRPPLRRWLSLLLIAGIVAAAPLEAHGRHCDATAASMEAMGAHDGHASQEHVSHSTVRPSSADCPHCPAADCARSPQCGTATAVAASAASRPVVSLHGARAGRPPLAEWFRSRPPLPPTPPPQPIL